MIKRFTFGTPTDTEAVLDKPAPCTFSDSRLIKTENGFRCTLFDREAVYGLGENVRGINKRGWTYTSDCSDDPHHQEDTHSLYGAHNFILLSGGSSLSEKLGIFIDTPSKVVFDIGYTDASELMITVDSPGFDLYVITAPSLLSAVTEFRQLIGKSYIPPFFAFGYGQSRWSYYSEDEIREVVSEYRRAGIPLDMVYMDIDYMDHYKDFTINEEVFPHFKEFVSEMRSQGIHLIPIIDGGVKLEPGYDVYEEGHRNGYFCKDENGEDFVIGVWPGDCCLPDMLNEEAGKWFGHKYKFLTDMGIDGFWNDMNEPALFYSKKNLTGIAQKIEAYDSQKQGINEVLSFKGIFEGVNNNPEDYASFYHDYKGKRYNHKDVHNLFGYYMTRRASESFDDFIDGEKPLLFSRSSYIGMHRYAGIWQGDNKSWWSHLKMNLQMMPSLNMCGFLYTGADIGGFGSDTTEDLLLRWLAVGIFTPLFRNHSASGTRRQEAYRFGDFEAFSDIIRLRYVLLPYLYNAYLDAANNNTLMFTPLSFLYPEDDIASEIEDQLFVGRDMMIAPVLEQNRTGRVVYLPEPMCLIRFKHTEAINEGCLDKGIHYVNIPLDEVVVFIKKGAGLPLGKPAQNLQCFDINDTYILNCD